MFIQTNDNNEIIQIIFAGEKPLVNGYEIDDIDKTILKNISDYKYINGEFVLKENSDIDRLNKIKEIKIKKMSDICNKIIENGITHNSAQYSLDVYDQIMISELRQMAINGNIVKYHANKSECRIYEAEEFLSLANTAAAYIDFHRTYFNRLRSDINDMTDINDVISVQYGQELSEKRNNEFITLMNGVTFDFVEIIDDTNYDYFCYDINTDNLITLENTQEKTDNIDDSLFDIPLSSDE